MIYSLCGAPFILCYFFISAHVMKSYTYFQRMAIPTSHLPPVSCLTPSIFILHIYTQFCLYGVHLPVGSLSTTHPLSVRLCRPIMGSLGDFEGYSLGVQVLEQLVQEQDQHVWKGLCLLGRCWLCLELVTRSCTEGSKGS